MCQSDSVSYTYTFTVCQCVIHIHFHCCVLKILGEVTLFLCSVLILVGKCQSTMRILNSVLSSVATFPVCLCPNLSVSCMQDS